MPPVDRNRPVRAKSSESKYSLMEFMQDFPDDAACLEWLWRARYSRDGEHAWCSSPSCKKQRTFKRYETSVRRQSWTCTACGTHVHPTAGTIFHKSSTSLHLWFYAMYLMTSTRCGISAKQLERELGVTYKTAWRMMHLIRNEVMEQDDDQLLRGEVEMDETYMGGKPRASDRKLTRSQKLDRKTAVHAAVERGGRVRAIASKYPHLSGGEAWANVRNLVKDDATLYTDDAGLYSGWDAVYDHHRINHSEKIYVSGEVHTQTIEGFFSTVKNGVRGVYHNVSRKHLQGYLNEYVWRYNHRDDDRAMFQSLLIRAATR
jgi:transposase-like protein